MIDHALLFTEIVYPYLPKSCILIYRSRVFLIANYDVLLFTDYSLGKSPVITVAYTAYVQLYTKKRAQYLVGDIDSSIFKAIPIKTTRYISEENPLDLSLPTYADYFIGKRLDSIRNGDLSLLFLGKIIYTIQKQENRGHTFFKHNYFLHFRGKK